MLRGKLKTEKWPFVKMHGAGNDFVMVDLRGIRADLSPETVSHACNRRLGIGADGLIALEMEANCCRMRYFNADGFEGSFCGNGARCFTLFANYLGLLEPGIPFEFNASDGLHQSLILQIDGRKAVVQLGMKDVAAWGRFETADQVDTGSPHLVYWPDEDPEQFPVYEKGKSIRYSGAFGEKGINVNFAWNIRNEKIMMRTYERGVEDETLACGTGTVAVALSAFRRFGMAPGTPIHARGGILEVAFEEQAGGFTNIRLSGPAEIVYEGIW